MARARNIKPGFFTNADLADCSPLARLFFIGLWQVCDREGRLVYRPRELKIKILPYDECDVHALVCELEKTGFIRFYSGNSGEELIWVVNFKKHQHVHPSEPKSELPEYTEEKIKPVLTGQKRPLTECLLLNAECLLLNADSEKVEHETKTTKEPKDGNSGQRLKEYLGENIVPADWANHCSSELGWSQSRIDDTFAVFYDYWTIGKGKSVRGTNWGARWRNWCAKDSSRDSSKVGGGVRDNALAAISAVASKRYGCV